MRKTIIKLLKRILYELESRERMEQMGKRIRQHCGGCGRCVAREFIWHGVELIGAHGVCPCQPGLYSGRGRWAMGSGRALG